MKNSVKTQGSSSPKSPGSPASPRSPVGTEKSPRGDENSALTLIDTSKQAPISMLKGAKFMRNNSITLAKGSQEGEAKASNNQDNNQITPAIHSEEFETNKAGELHIAKDLLPSDRDAVTPADPDARCSLCPANACISYGMALALLLLITSVVYFLISLIVVFDKKGKEAFFDEDSTERTFEEAMQLKKGNPTWNIRTNDWGFIHRTFDNVIHGDYSWGEYDIFLAIIITAGVTSLYWFVVMLIALHRFRTKNWSSWKTSTIQGAIGALMFFSGNLAILYRIQLFRSDMVGTFEMCNCPSFKKDYMRSVSLYQYTVYVVAVIALLQLCSNFFMCFNMCTTRVTPLPVSPETEQQEEAKNAGENSVAEKPPEVLDLSSGIPQVEEIK